METTTLNVLTLAIQKMDVEDLRIVSRLLADRHDELARLVRNDLQYGSKVQFKTRSGFPVTGTVLSSTPKRVKVRAEDGRLWTVSPQLLKIII